MIQRISFLALLCLLSNSVQAQQPHNAEVTIVHRGIGSLQDDVANMLKLATPEEQEQEENIIGTIQLIELGIDPKMPIRIDILTGFTAPRYVTQVGYIGPEIDILDNVTSNFPAKKVNDTLWELLPPDRGWFRLIPKVKTAILILTAESDHQLLKQLILKVTNPLPEAQAMLSDGFNIAARLRNTTFSEEDQAKRRAAYQETKALQLDALQQRPNETKTEFALRKGLASNQLLEIERLMAEAKEAKALLGFDSETYQATVKFEATAIEGTSFEKTLQEFGGKPDQFDSIAKPQDSVFSLRVNHPVDELRQANLNRTMDLLKADSADRLSRNESISDDTRKAAGDLIEGCLQVARDTTAEGNFNGFWEKVPAGDGFVGYGAIVAKDAGRLAEVFSNAAKTGSGNSIKTGIATVGDVQIHEVKFEKGFFSTFDVIFDGKVGYIGTTDDKLWIATGGEAALEPLKAAIESLKAPAENDVILTMEGRLLPFVQQTIRVIEKLEEPKTAALKTARQDSLQQLKIAEEAFQAEDGASFRMDVKDGKATGQFSFEKGTMRFLARLLATYSKNNLQ